MIIYDIKMSYLVSSPNKKSNKWYYLRNNKRNDLFYPFIICRMHMVAPQFPIISFLFANILLRRYAICDFLFIILCLRYSSCCQFKYIHRTQTLAPLGRLLPLIYFLYLERPYSDYRSVKLQIVTSWSLRLYKIHNLCWVYLNTYALLLFWFSLLLFVDYLNDAYRRLTVWQ